MTAEPAPPTGRKSTPYTRTRARQLALQALYQWELAGGTAAEIEQQFLAEQNTKRTDLGYFHDLLKDAIGQNDTLREAIEPLLDRPWQRLDPIERSVLRIGAYELRERLEVPYGVVINEGIELAKVFGATGGHKYINGVLDRLAAKWRQAELSTKR